MSKRSRPKTSPSADAKPSATSIDLSKLPKLQSVALPLIWVDKMEVAIRGDVPVATLRFYSVVGGEAVVEACRLQMSTAHLRAMVDVISKSIEYYPEAPTK